MISRAWRSMDRAFYMRSHRSRVPDEGFEKSDREKLVRFGIDDDRLVALRARGQHGHLHPQRPVEAIGFPRLAPFLQRSSRGQAHRHHRQRNRFGCRCGDQARVDDQGHEPASDRPVSRRLRAPLLHTSTRTAAFNRSDQQPGRLRSTRCCHSRVPVPLPTSSRSVRAPLLDKPGSNPTKATAAPSRDPAFPVCRQPHHG